jgi:HEAT repeat protein
VKVFAIGALAQLAPESKKALPTLIRLLNDERNWIRECALRAISRLGPDAAEAVPILLAHLDNDRNRYIYTSIIRALGKIGAMPDKVVPKLARLLEHPNPVVKSAAAEAIGVYGDRVPVHVIRTIAALLNHKDGGVKVSAVSALRQIGPAAAVVVDDLKLLLAHPSENTWVPAVLAISMMGEAASSVTPVLLEKLEVYLDGPDSTEVTVRDSGLGLTSEYEVTAVTVGNYTSPHLALLDALRSVGYGDEKLLDLLVKKVVAQGKNVSRRTIHCLRLIGDPSVMPILTQAAKLQEDETVKAYILETVAALGGE